MVNNNMNVTSRAPGAASNWWESGSTGFLNRQRELGVWGRFGPPGRNQAPTSPEFQGQLTNLRSSAEGLRTAVRDMQGSNRNANSAFASRVPTSGDTDLMTISSFDASRTRGATDFSVEIIQTAVAQRNEGAAMDATALAVEEGFELGANQISINVGNQQFDFNFNVSAADTVRDVQQRIADAINARADVPVRASVDFNATDETSALVLESAQTGVRRAGEDNFTVSGNAATLMEIDTVTQAAQDAQFRVNRGNVTGALQTSRTNDVNLGHGINARLEGTGTVEVSMARDERSQINAFRNLVNQFNDLMEAARAGGDNRNANRLERDLRNIAQANSSTLSGAGITMNRDGFLSINETQMSEAAERGDLERIATGGSFGLMNRLDSVASSVIRNPASFVDRTDANDWQNFNTFQSTRMNMFGNMGLLFDSWF